MHRLFTPLLFLALALIPSLLHAQAAVDDLFRLQTNQDQAKDFVTEAVFYHLNPERLRQLERERPFEWQLQLPLADKSPLTLNLQRHQITTDDFKVNTPEGEMAVETGVFYKGRVQGDKNSHVAISIFKDHVVGFLTYEGKSHELGHLQQGAYPASTEYIFYNVANMLMQKNFECGTEEAKIGQQPASPAQANSADKVVKIYIEADYDAYQEKGSSVQNVVDYIEGFFNEVAVLYTNESINVQISEIFVWTTQDPYTGTITIPFVGTVNLDGSGASLQPFADRMDNIGFDGNIAHLIQMVSQGNDGIAVTGSLCGDNPYAYSDVEAAFNQYPAYSWTVQVFTHENGHVLGSEHTTVCTWGPNNNQRLESLCPGEFPSDFCSIVSPPVTETIMNPGCVRPDFSKGFGDDPGDLIRNEVATANCLDELSVPLDMLHFDGTITEKGNQLRWQTANEVNTKWHIIERSPNGKHHFTEVGRVAAAGYATQAQDYEWLDAQPLAEAYYRLKTLDADGQKHFSKLIRLENKPQENSLRLTNVHPVPATDWLQLEFQSPDNQNIEIQFIDLYGRVVQALSQKSVVGTNVLNLETAKLAAGLYILQITDAQGRQLSQNVVIE